MTEEIKSVPQLRKDVTLAVIAGILRDSDKMWATLAHYEPDEKYKHIAEAIYNTFRAPNQGESHIETVYGGEKLFPRHDPRCDVYLSKQCSCGLTRAAQPPDRLEHNPNE